MERRELFDSLDLPEEFTTTDYEIALEEKGAKVKSSNEMMIELNV